MKLTNISLAILVALGLAACGGSDDNNDQTTDPKKTTPIKKEEGPKETPTTTTPPKSGLDPERVAPDLTVPKDLQTDVNVSKATYLSRGFADNALGYFSGSYDKNRGTKPADIKYSSVYNYLEAGDLVDSKSPGYGTTAEGGIYVGNKPEDGILTNAFVKIGDTYYRVQAENNAAAFTPDTKFVLVRHVEIGSGNAFVDMPVSGTGLTDVQKGDMIYKLYNDKNYAVAGSGVNNTGKKKFDQSEVVFIANVDMLPWKLSGADAADATKLNESLQITLGKTSGFAGKTGQTVLHNVSTLGNEYNPSITGQSLDFSKLAVDKEKIQFVDVNSTFTITNDKNNNDAGDDFSVNREIELGKIKAYNLPYSIAYVTVDPSKENEKNIFKLDAGTTGDLTNGSYQVRGYQTIALPKQGRAHYTGKSFNERVEGDVKLTADFFEDRAGVQGTVTNRKDVVKNKALPNLRLDLLTLTDPDKHGTFAYTGQPGLNNNKGKVYGDPKVDSWSVQFYGLEAQEAGGKIYGTNYEEVYTTQRGRLTNQSNTADVK